MDMEAATYYFETLGDHTGRALEVAKAKALQRDAKHVVVASTRGETGVKAAEAFKDTGTEVIVVTHQTGHRGPGVQQLTDENGMVSVLIPLVAPALVLTWATTAQGSEPGILSPRSSLL